MIDSSKASPSGDFAIRYMPVRDSFSIIKSDTLHSGVGTQSTGCGASNGCGNLTYHNGSVMHHPADFLIFWLPSGYSFDNPSIDPQSIGTSDASYEQLIIQYFLDICQPNSFYTIVQQYHDATNSIGSCSLGGYWVDNSNLPGGRGSQTNPLTGADIQNEVSSAMLAKGWSSNNGNNEFFVFTAYGVITSGFGTFYCAYHGSFPSSTGSSVVYSNMPEAGTFPLNCGVGSSPNNDLFADYEINIASHEQFESFTDPTGGGWFYLDGRHEIGDECAWIFGTSSATLLISADYYRIQLEWSNSAGGCQGFIPPPEGLFGQYWPNSFFGAPLSGCTTYTSPITPTTTPTITETDPTISYGVATGWNWHPRNFDEFSVKWTGSISTIVPGTYSFKLASDDGSWLYIDSASIVNHGGTHSPTDPPGTGTISLSQGIHQIEVDYYETCSVTSAGIDLSWTPPNTSSSLIVPTYVLNPPVSLDGQGVRQNCVGTTCQLLSTKSAPDVILAIAECGSSGGSCDSITPSIQDSSGLQFTLHRSYCYVGLFDSCLWEYYSIANYALSNDNITVSPFPGVRNLITFAISSANTNSIFDPGLPVDQHCGASDGSPADCKVNFTISPSPASGPYEFLFANTAINDAPACNATFAPGWTQINNGNVEADYRAIINSQRSYSFTCDKYADPLILMADGVQSQGPDFKISTISSTVTTNAGSNGSIPISLTPLNTFAGTVNLSITETPSAGVNCTLSPLSILLSVAQNSTLSCSGSGGTYGINITGLTGSLSHSLTVTFRSQDFSVSSNPTQITDVVTSNSSSTLTVSGLGGFSGNISLTTSVSSPLLIASGGAGGGRHAIEMAPMTVVPTVSLNQTIIPVQGANARSCVLTISVPLGVAAGNYTIIVSTSGGGLAHFTSLLLVVTDFGLAPSSNNLNLAPGVNASTIVNIYSLNGFQGNITSTVNVSPAGLTVSLTPTILSVSVGVPNGLTLKIITSSSTPAGNYTLTIVSSIGTLSHTASIVVTVQSGASENAFVRSLVGRSSLALMFLGLIGTLIMIPITKSKALRNCHLGRRSETVNVHHNHRGHPRTFQIAGFAGLTLGVPINHASNYLEHLMD